MKLFTEISKEDIIDGDCIKIEIICTKMSTKGGGSQSERVEHAYYKDGEFLSVIDNQPIDVSKYIVKYFLHNYKFVSLADEWYIEGTEVYPDAENWGDKSDNWKQDGWTLFQGLTYKDNFNEMEGTGPVWDGETCPFEEFNITERINQTRARKLKRIINE